MPRLPTGGSCHAWSKTCRSDRAMANAMKSDETIDEKPVRIRLRRAGHKMLRLDRPVDPGAAINPKAEAVEGSGGLIDRILEAIRSNPAERRRDPRHEGVEREVWVGWWTGDDFGAISGVLLNVSSPQRRADRRASDAGRRRRPRCGSTRTSEPLSPRSAPRSWATCLRPAGRIPSASGLRLPVRRSSARRSSAVKTARGSRRSLTRAAGPRWGLERIASAGEDGSVAGFP